MTRSEAEKRRRSFVYGNVGLSNPHVTREMVDDVAEELGRAAPRREADKLLAWGFVVAITAIVAALISGCGA